MTANVDASPMVTVRGPGWLAAFASAAETPDHLVPEALAERAGTWASQALGFNVPVLYAEQRHTAILFAYASHKPLAARPHCVGVCDGLLTGDSGVVLTVRTADCLPMILAGGGVVAALHCGWRSLAGDILGRCVRRLAVEFGVGAEALEAVIGVGIGPCHYSVGMEVEEALGALPVRASLWRQDGRVDLAAWARGRLLALGIEGERVLTLPGCTACSPHHHSFRRDGSGAGRQWAAVVLS